MKLCMIGVGYVGLTTGVCLAEIGHNVTGVDIDDEKIRKLNNGVCPIYEPGLEELMKKNSERLSFTTNLTKAIKESDIIFIAVGTPPKSGGEADLYYIEQCARQIADHADSYKVIVDKSTVPVETGEKVAETIKRYNPHNIDFDVVSNPEFLREGSAVNDFLEPDRIVIGVLSKRAEEAMRKLYEPIKAPLIVTDIRSAEIIKHASNSFLATKISFTNSLAQICEKAGADIEFVTKGMGLDKRIGDKFLNAGVGYGGSCFKKDVSAFINIAEKFGYDFKILKSVQEVNINQRKHFIKKIEDAIWILKDKKAGVLGLAFKPNTDDMRDAPSIDVIDFLLKEGSVVTAYDPKAMEVARARFPSICYAKDSYEVCKDADVLIIMTEWDEFRNLDLRKVKSLMKQPVIVDGRNIYDQKEVDKLGFTYICMGRSIVS